MKVQDHGDGRFSVEVDDEFMAAVHREAALAGVTPERYFAEGLLRQFEKMGFPPGGELPQILDLFER